MNDKSLSNFIMKLMECFNYSTTIERFPEFLHNGRIYHNPSSMEENWKSRTGEDFPKGRI